MKKCAKKYVDGNLVVGRYMILWRKEATCAARILSAGEERGKYRMCYEILTGDIDRGKRFKSVFDPKQLPRCVLKTAMGCMGRLLRSEGWERCKHKRVKGGARKLQR